jgi:hypothetical protein
MNKINKGPNAFVACKLKVQK